MNTLIFNGSPRRKGDTDALIEAFTSCLRGETQIVRCYEANIRPCVDCRACKTDFYCVISDEMRSVYAAIHSADNIVIASPVHYSELTGQLLAVLSRLQPAHYARLRNEAGFSDKPRRGGILLVGGGNGSPAPAIARARILLRMMGCKETAEPIMSLNTDTLPASQDHEALSAARALGERFSQK